MKTKSVFVLACIFLISTGASAQHNLEKFNTLRFAQFFTGTEWAAIPNGNFNDFLSRSSANRYNYIGIKLDFSFLSGSGPYTDNPALNFTDLKNSWQQVFTKIKNNSLRVIPIVETHNPSSKNWQRFNANIKVNTCQDNSAKFKRAFDWSCPSFAYDPEYHNTFRDFLSKLKEAFAASSSKYPLEYILLCYDEFANPYTEISASYTPAYAPLTINGRRYNNISLIGGGPANCSKAFSQFDRDYITDLIKNQGKSVNTAFQSILVKSIYDELCDVQTVLGGSVKVLIWADQIDPEASAQFSYNAFNGYSYNMTPGFESLPGLSSTEAQRFKKNVIVVPWNYLNHFINVPGAKTYSPANTFNYLANNGFKFIFAAGYVGGLADNECTFPWITKEGFSSMQNYVSNSLHFKNNCIGYGATWWHNPEVGLNAAGQPECQLEIQGDLFNEEQTNIPSVSFNN